MWSEKQIDEYLKESIHESRYIHIIGVVKTSQKLAEIYGADVQKARLAAYIHDAAKYLPKNEIISLIEDNGYELTEEDKEMPHLLHGLAGAIIGKNEMDIQDEEVFNAARYHTTGREKMTVLEKIIFVADFIEPSRNYPGVEYLRELTFLDLDKALMQAFDNTIKYVIERGLMLHTDTIKSRNYLIKQLRQNLK